MLSTGSPIPSICITPPPPEEIHSDPYSPIFSVKLDVEDDGYRAKWLSVPPSDTSLWCSSPLRSVDCPPTKGLSRDKFISLLEQSRSHRANLGVQRKPDLHEESAQRNKRLGQLERRARFLFRVKEPLCTAAISTCIPEVPQESPTIDYCLVSPRGFKPKFSTLRAVVEGRDGVVIVDPRINPERHERLERSQHTAKQPLITLKHHTAPERLRRVSFLQGAAARQKSVHVYPTKDWPQSRVLSRALNLPAGSTGNHIKAFPVRSFTLGDEQSDVAQQVSPSRYPDSHALKLRSSHADTAPDLNLKRGSPHTGLGYHECPWIATGTTKRSPRIKLQNSIGLNHVAVSQVAVEICGRICRVLSVAIQRARHLPDGLGYITFLL